MKFVAIALFVLVAGAFAQHQHNAPLHHVGDDAHAEVLRSDSAVNADSYQYQYETSNGIAAKSAGQLKQVGTESGIVQQGDFSYTGADNVKYTVSYIADENGYQPTGAHLPVGPEIPEYIVRSLEYIASHPSAENKKGF